MPSAGQSIPGSDLGALRNTLHLQGRLRPFHEHKAVGSIRTSLEQLCLCFLEATARSSVQLVLGEKDRLHDEADNDETQSEDRELENCDVHFQVGNVLPGRRSLTTVIGSIGNVTSNNYERDLRLLKTEQLVAVARGSGASLTGHVLM